MSFKAYYGQDPKIGFEGRKKGKYEEVKRFVEKIKEIQKETKSVLEKVQKEMKKYADRKRGEADKYKVGNLVILSTKDLKYQMVRRRTEKLTERFVGPYKIKKIMLLNIVELKLSSIIEIHLVVNISRVQRYIGQVEGQKRSNQCQKNMQVRLQ